jgi:hypothetical protein
MMILNAVEREVKNDPAIAQPSQLSSNLDGCYCARVCLLASPSYDHSYMDAALDFAS